MGVLLYRDSWHMVTGHMESLAVKAGWAKVVASCLEVAQTAVVFPVNLKPAEGRTAAAEAWDTAAVVAPCCPSRSILPSQSRRKARCPPWTFTHARP
jgi:hypothetical protein